MSMQKHGMNDFDFDAFILEQLPVGVALFDAQDLRLLQANPAYFTITHLLSNFDWSSEQVMGQRLQDSLAPSMSATEVEQIVAMYRGVAETGIPFHTNAPRAIIADETNNYWDLSLYPVRGNDGKIVQIVSTVCDISSYVENFQQAEQTQAQLSLERDTILQERQRLEVIETVARIVGESLDIQWVCKAVIETLVKNLQPLHAGIHKSIPEQEVLHPLSLYSSPHGPPDVLPTTNISYQCDLLLVKARLRHEAIVIEDVPLAVSMGVLNEHHPLVKLAIQAYICIPLWFHDHFEGTLTVALNTAISTHSNEVQTLEGCAGYLAAALAHARLREQVENERARLRAVLDQAPEGVIIIEAKDEKISYINPTADHITGLHSSKYDGYSIAQFVQKHAIADLDGKPRARQNLLTIRALRGEVINGDEIMIALDDGNSATLLVSAAPLRTENGEINGAVMAFQDITERKAIERQKNEFLQVASHELRTPITTIQGLAEILQALENDRRSLRAPRCLRAIGEIIEQSQRLIELIDQMIDLTRIENEQLLLNCAHHDVLTTVREVIESHAITSFQHTITLNLDGFMTNDSLTGYFDKERIKQALSNLISNALKFSPPGSEVEIGIHYTPALPGEALIWIKDAGAGIPPDELAHIFERFHRTSNQHYFKSRLGIGLYLVKELITRHHGRVWVESTEGTGSTFHILLPLHGQ